MNNITNQTIYGNYTSVENSGSTGDINIVVAVRDERSVVSALEGAGIASEDAEDFAKIVASETPDGSGQPFGKRAKAWVGENLKKAVDGTWKVGVAVASQVLTEAATRYYGLK